jgi:hypothetical protein
VGSKEVTELPLTTCNYTQIIALSPGVVANVTRAAPIGNGTQDVNVKGSGVTYKSVAETYLPRGPSDLKKGKRCLSSRFRSNIKDAGGFEDVVQS